MTTTPARWQPTDDQLNFEIAPAYTEIMDQLRDLKGSLGCPDSFIREFLVEWLGDEFSDPE
ncbi:MULTISPECIES: hypothetical protein [unclassified Synechococcus]|uniref:hypothetical protein n=1 Tax=unclassified Synechococcus TaxID=2626047 RepID=UPI001C23AD39|nr:MULTISPECIES: hypothetical protein [unclassified Synechococcus]